MSDIKGLAKKVSFISKISLLSEAIADNENPTPSYMYKEIADISKESGSHCEDLSDFLVEQLTNKSLNIKYKVLKVIKHVSVHGHPDFRQKLRKTCGAHITEALKCGGPPDPRQGMEPYYKIRAEAKELSEILYSTSEEELARRAEPVVRVDPGIGNVGGSALTGFGNTTDQPLSMSESLVSGVRHFADRVMSPTSPPGGTRRAQPADRRFGHYEPVRLEAGVSMDASAAIATTSDADAAKQHTARHEPSIMTASSIGYKKGIPGGGWADEEEQDEIQDAGSNLAALQSHQSTISHEAANQQEFTEKVSERAASDENDVITQYLQITPLSHAHIRDFIQKCETLNVENVLKAFNVGLTQNGDEASKLNCLLLLEGLIRTDLETPAIILKSCSQGLKASQNNTKIKAKADKILKTLEMLCGLSHQHET